MLIRLFSTLLALLLLLLGVRPAEADMGGDFRRAGRAAKGGGVTVAVLSSGVDPSIRALKGRVKPGKDLLGMRTAKTMGTALASLVGRLAPRAEILPVRVRMERDDAGFAAWWKDTRRERDGLLARGIGYAAGQRADVILIDMETGLDSAEMPLTREAIAAAGSGGSVVVAGNSTRWRWGGFPAAAPGVIGVGVLGPGGRPAASFANSSVLVSAPGARTRSAGPRNATVTVWGSSVSAAWVAAAAALIRAAHPGLPPALVSRAISGSARHPKGGYNTKVGFGAVNPAAALAEAGRLKALKPTATVVTDDSHFGGAAPAARDTDDGSALRVWASGGLILGGLSALVFAVALRARVRRTQ